MMTSSISSARVALTLAVIALGGYLVVPDAQTRAVRHLPTPPGGRLLLTLRMMSGQGRRIYDYILEQCIRFHGKPWRMQLLGRPVTVIVSSVADVEHVLKTQFESFVKGPYTSDVLYDVLGQGIFAVDGALWAHQRKTASHLFSLQMMREIIEESVREYCGLLCEKLRTVATNDDKNTVEIKRLLDLFTMDVFTKIGFGVDVGGLRGQDNQAFLDAFERSSLALLYRFQQPMWLWRLKKWLNLGAIEPQLKKDMQVIDGMTHKIISQSIAEQGTAIQHRNLVGLFLEKTPEIRGEDGTVDPVLIRDMSMSFIAAGRDTTSQSMSWFLVMMNRYPSVLERVRSELKTKLPHVFNSGAIPTMEEVHDLVYLEAAIKESIRLNPVVAITTRTAATDTTLYDGTFIRQGTRVVYSSYAMARMPSVWGEDAEVYNPSRWIDQDTGKILQVSPFQYPVFLAGPRTCLGMKFALMEMKITIAALVSQFDLHTVADPFSFTYRAAVTMGVRGPLDVKVTARQ